MSARREDPAERLDTLLACLDAVSDLLSPERDLHAVSRENLSLLMWFLMTELKQARAECGRIK
jgi:hypothetical protein